MSKIIRSHTRKVVFGYIYMKIFGLMYNQMQDNFIKPIPEEIYFEEDDREFLSHLVTPLDIDTTDTFRYNFDDLDRDMSFICNWFHVDIDNLDQEFMSNILAWLDSWYKDIETILKPFLMQFDYQDMDMVKQSLLLLAYLEHKHIKTAPTIIINEAVELAKLYWSPDVYKMINGVLHNYLKSINTISSDMSI